MVSFKLCMFASLAHGSLAYLSLVVFSRNLYQTLQHLPHRAGQVTSQSIGATSTTSLASGRGVASNYSWNEDAYEIDIKVRVPRETKAKDIIFRATSHSIDLRMRQQKQLLGKEEKNSSSSNDDEVIVTLLDASRPLRGRINLDGTYWVIADPEEDGRIVAENSDNDESTVDDTSTITSKTTFNYREVVVTIEKLIRTPRDDFDVIEYDWRGVYSDDELKDNITVRVYDQPEVLNVREYAASLGVDIDNINMSMVDKSMYTSGLNLTQKSLEQLSEAGYVQEVTQQSDGKEFIVQQQQENENNENEAITGSPIPFAPLGGGISDQEWQQFAPAKLDLEGAMEEGDSDPSAESIEFPSTDMGAIQLDAETNQTYIQLKRNFTRAAYAYDSATTSSTSTAASSSSSQLDDDEKVGITVETTRPPIDPIDTLTVKRLKEILKSQGLKVTGSKAELQARLRQQVNALLQGKQDHGE